MLDVFLNKSNISFTDYPDRRTSGSGPSDRLKQAKHSRGPAAVLQASEKSGLFIFPIAWTVMFAREHLGHTGQI